VTIGMDMWLPPGGSTRASTAVRLATEIENGFCSHFPSQSQLIVTHGSLTRV